MKFIIIIFTFSLTVLVPVYPQKNEPATVPSVDLKKYTGTWYEIAKIPNSFQDDCYKNTTATYKIMEDGKIEVLNRCVEKKRRR